MDTSSIQGMAAISRGRFSLVRSCPALTPSPAARAKLRDTGIGITVDTIYRQRRVEAAVRGKKIVASASSARTPEPILYGKWLADCRLLCAVGNTRKQFAETDVQCFRDASLVVVDTPHAFEEAGELHQAVKAGAVPENKRATLGQIVTGAASIPDQGMIVFKSVGSALQDLALASRYHELLGARPGWPVVDEVGSLRKPLW